MTINSRTPLLDAAVAYTAAGYAVVPVPAGQKAPVLKGWPNFEPGPEGLAAYFNGEGNIGLNLGKPSGWLVDVDLDCEEAIELADSFLPPTAAVSGRESRPGSHRWYICPGATTRKFADRVTGEMIAELRSTGCQTLVAPSTHPNGDRYDGPSGTPASVDHETLVVAMTALANAVNERRHGPAPEPPAPPTAPPRGSGPSGSDADRAAAYLEAIPGAIAGQGGHSQTYAAATSIIHGFALDEETGFQLLRDRYNPRCQPPWTDEELRHKAHDAATKEHKMPRGWLRDADRRCALPPPAGGGEMDLEPLTDLGNAERFSRSFAEHVRYSKVSDAWFVWDGTRWQEDRRGLPVRLAGTMARQIAAEAGRLPDVLAQLEAVRWAKRSESRGKIEATVALARAQEGCAIALDDLDADPMLLNVRNGTIDLRTGQLREHRRDDLMTKLAPVEYDPDAACPLFEEFLRTVFAGDEELIGFVVRLLGHCLTGDITEQVFPIFHGGGANGKSVLLDTVAGLMGDYAGDAPPFLLVDTRFHEHATEFANLRGLRLVVASETEADAKLKLQTVKRLTGDTTIKARQMRENYFTFKRQCKVVLVTNNQPRVHERSEAVWRRVRLVPFGVTIPEAQRDTRLIHKLRDEWPGILALLVRGCLDWQRDGLGCPSAVELATAEYRADEDVVGRFLAECFETEPFGAATALVTPWREVRRRYDAWCQREGEQPATDKALGTDLSKRGFPSTTHRLATGTCKCRRGLKPRDEGVEP